MNKKPSWTDDVLVRVSRDTRAKLKLKAALKAVTIKDLLEKYANTK